MATYTPTYADIDYRPAGTNNGKQYVDIYHPPTGSGPFPTFLFFPIGGFTGSARPASFTSENFLVGAVLEAGWAVAYVEQSVAAINPPTGTTTAVGGGMFRHPLADSEYDLDGGGDDICYIDAISAVQHLRYNAATYNLDPNLFVVGGRSAGAANAAWVAFGPDAADPGNPIAQREVSSRVQGAYILQAATMWFHAIVQDSSIFPAGDWWFLRDSVDDTIPARDLNAAASGHKSAASIGFLTTNTAAQAQLNAVTPCYAAVIPKEIITTPGGLEWGLAANNTPLMFATDTEGLFDPHHLWHGAMLIKALRNLSPFHTTHSRLAVMDSYWDFENEIAADVLLGSIYNDDDLVEWLAQEFLSLGGVDTIDMRYDWQGTTSVQMLGIQTPALGGMVQRRRTSTATSQFSAAVATRVWRVTWRAATRAEHDRILAAWYASRGGALAVNFRPPDNSMVLARFISGSFRSRQNGPHSFALSVDLEEVI